MFLERTVLTEYVEVWSIQVDSEAQAKTSIEQMNHDLIDKSNQKKTSQRHVSISNSVLTLENTVKQYD